MSLFNKLKDKQAPAEKKSSAKKEHVLVVKNKDNKDASGDTLFENIKAFRDKKAEADVLKGEIDALDVEIRSECMEVFEKDTMQSGFKGTVVVQAVHTKGMAARIQFIPTDKYKKLDEDKAGELRAMYGDDIVTETDNVTVNVELFKKYEKQFEALLKKIAPEEADKIFQINTTYEVSKGSVENIAALAKKRKEKVTETMMNLGVITNLKAPKAEDEVSAAKSSLARVNNSK